MKIKPFKLERYYTQYEFTAKYSLCNSDCETMTINELLSLEAGASEAFGNMRLGYTETKGNPELRQDVAKSYTNIGPEDMFICTGAQEPIFLFSSANLEAGDEVIVQAPCYQSLQSIPESMGCKVLSWLVRHVDNRPTFDLQELKEMITDKTKVIYLNTPHNPTGFHFSKGEQEAIIQLARANNILIFCDEVYRGVEHTQEAVIPAIADVYENGISLGVMSKSYGLPGLRIGWVASQNKAVLDNIAILKEYTTICNSGPSEFLAGVALRNSENILAKNLAIIKANLSLYDQFFDKYGDLFSWYKPSAGPIAFVKMNFAKDDIAFADSVRKKQSVLLLPGGIYDYEGYFRIGFGRTEIPEALSQFEVFIKENLVRV